MPAKQKPSPSSLGDVPNARLEAARPSLEYNDGVVSNGTHGVHKRFQSEEAEPQVEDITTPALVTDNVGRASNEVDLSDLPIDASEDEGPPVTMGIAGRQSFHFLPALRKSKPRKSRRARTPDSGALREISAAQISTPPTESHNNEANGTTSLKTPKLPSRSTKTIRAKVRNFTKNGVTYRSLDDPRLQGDSSKGLPPKANNESAKRRETLLGKKGAREVRRGRRRPKFSIVPSK